MSIACPTCGSRFLRESQPRTPEERKLRWNFKSPLRCLDCKTRFIASNLLFTELMFARCPHCSRMDLNGWAHKSHNPPFWTRLKITLGAQRLRCEYCRRNFASFRRRKEAFTFKRWEKINAGAAKAQGRARANQLRAHEEGRMLVADLTIRPASTSDNFKGALPSDE